MPRRVLITGAGGRVAHQLLPGLRPHYELRLTDRERADELSDVGEWVTGELNDPEVLRRAVDGVDTIVHLSGDPDPRGRWDSLESANIEAFRELLTAARAAGVSRMIYASSIHAMGQYEADGEVPVNPLWPPAPCCSYGATKAFDEALARVFARRGQVSTIGLRLGATVPEPAVPNQIGAWLGPSDLQQLVRRSIETGVQFGVYFGVSNNSRSHFELSNARSDLGYAPILDSERWFEGADDELTTCAP